MTNIVLIILFAFVSMCIYYKMLKNPARSINYKHPSYAIGVGPVWTENQGPISYMYVWRDKEARRLHMEFRNLPGVVVSADDKVIQELSEALKQL